MNIREALKNEIEAILEILPKIRDNCKMYEANLRNLYTLINLAEKLRGE